MKNRRVLAASLLVSLMTVAGVSAAAQPGMPMDRQAPGTPFSGMPGAMGGPMPGMMTGPLGDQMPGMMMGGRPGMNGMGAMMAGCPMMGAMTGVLTPQQHMKMHAEMMQAMGQIMEKYATQAEKGSN
ncbi:MAG: hypothetical protein AB7E12_05720 [Burkholderiaceae bacterium]